MTSGMRGTLDEGPQGGPRKTFVPRGRLAEDVAGYLRDAILSGELKAGERIDQAAIAEMVGSSKLPVREALIALEAEGIVEIRPRRGAFVSPLTREDILDHYVVFGRVAGLAAERAATGLDFKALEDLGEVNRAMREAGDPEEAARLNEQFHQIISRAGASSRLKHVLRQLSDALPTRFFEFAGDPDGSSSSAAEHEAILDALRARDPEAANAAMARHFENRGLEAQRALQARGFWS